MIFTKILKNTNQIKKIKIMIVFDDMIVDMLSSKKLNPIVTELFTRGRKLDTFLIFITQSHFAVPRSIRLNSRHYFVMKIPKCTAKAYYFFVTDTTLASDNSSNFRKNLFERI